MVIAMDTTIGMFMLTAHFRGCYVQASMELGPEYVSLLERCPHFRGCYVQASMELGPEDVSLLERCPHFRGCYVQASMELGPEDVSLLERCPRVAITMDTTRLQWSRDLKCIPIGMRAMITALFTSKAHKASCYPEIKSLFSNKKQ